MNVIFLLPGLYKYVLDVEYLGWSVFHFFRNHSSHSVEKLLNGRINNDLLKILA